LPSVKGVDGLGLGVCDRDLRHGRQVASSGEREQVVDRRRDTLMAGGDEVGSARAERATADPRLPGAPFPGRPGIAGVHQRGMHRENGDRVDPICQCDSGFHRFGVVDDQCRVTAAGVAEGLGLGNSTRRGGQVGSRLAY
jgi:hypothetical protein